MRIWLRQWIYLRLQHFPAVSCYICVSSCFILQFKPSKAKGDCLLTQVWVGGLSTCESVCSGLDAPFFHMNTLLEDTTQPIGPPWWRQGSSCVCVCAPLSICVCYLSSVYGCWYLLGCMCMRVWQKTMSRAQCATGVALSWNWFAAISEHSIASSISCVETP